jgi:hypothetical protein
VKRLAGVIAAGSAVFVVLHELGRRWGATRDEVRGPMVGDDIVSDAKGQTTHAITIQAGAEEVCPGSCRWAITGLAGTRTRGSTDTSGTSKTRALPGSSPSYSICRWATPCPTANQAPPSTAWRCWMPRARSCCTPRAGCSRRSSQTNASVCGAIW